MFSHSAGGGTFCTIAGSRSLAEPAASRTSGRLSWLPVLAKLRRCSEQQRSCRWPDHGRCFAVRIPSVIRVHSSRGREPRVAPRLSGVRASRRLIRIFTICGARSSASTPQLRRICWHWQHLPADPCVANCPQVAVRVCTAALIKIAPSACQTHNLFCYNAAATALLRAAGHEPAVCSCMFSGAR